MNAAQQAAQFGMPETNREADAYRQMAEARAGTVETTAAFQASEEARRLKERQQAEQEAAKEQEQLFKKTGAALVEAFDQVGSDIASAVSSAVSEIDHRYSQPARHR